MMRSGVAALAILLALLSAPSPAEGQTTAPPAPQGGEAGEAVRPAHAAVGLVPPHPRESVGESERFLSAAFLDEQGSRRSSTVGYTIGGALAGALVGVGALYLTNDNCTQTGSMCGLSIPLYAGAGAVGGGLVGYLIGRTRN